MFFLSIHVILKVNYIIVKINRFQSRLKTCLFYSLFLHYIIVKKDDYTELVSLRKYWLTLKHQFIKFIYKYSISET